MPSGSRRLESLPSKMQGTALGQREQMLPLSQLAGWVWLLASQSASVPTISARWMGRIGCQLRVGQNT